MMDSFTMADSITAFWPIVTCGPMMELLILQPLPMLTGWMTMVLS